MNDFVATRIENLKPKEERKKSSAASKKPKDKKYTKERKQEDSDSSDIKSSKDSSVEHKPVKRYCILHWKWSHSTGYYKDLLTMANNHKQTKKSNFKTYGKSKKELNA